MRSYYELLTDLEMNEVDQILAGHPKEAKVRLAKSVIREYHDESAGDAAAARWQREIGEGELPGDIPSHPLRRSQLNADGGMQAAQLLKELGLVPSTSVAMQRIKGNAAFILYGDEKKTLADRAEWVRVEDGMIVRAGKKDWRRVTLTD
jgi:tyrosyl-tRNA synthetase